jgi:hypothetical protein
MAELWPQNLLLHQSSPDGTKVPLVPLAAALASVVLVLTLLGTVSEPMVAWEDLFRPLGKRSRRQFLIPHFLFSFFSIFVCPKYACYRL